MLFLSPALSCGGGHHVPDPVSEGEEIYAVPAISVSLNCAANADLPRHSHDAITSSLCGPLK